MLAFASTGLDRPARNRTICPQNRRKGVSRSSARGPCCHFHVVSPQKTAVRPFSTGCTASTGMSPAAGLTARTEAPGFGPATLVHPSRSGNPLSLAGRFLRGKYWAMLAKIGCPAPSGVSCGRKGSLICPISLPPNCIGRISPSGVPAYPPGPRLYFPPIITRPGAALGPAGRSTVAEGCG